MAKYIFQCNDCNKDVDVNNWLTFDHCQGMNCEDKPPCPECGGCNTSKTFVGYTEEDIPTHYVRGNGYLDRKGCNIDQQLWKLQNEDPYAHCRPPGDKSDLEHKLKKSTKFNPQRRHYVGGINKK